METQVSVARMGLPQPIVRAPAPPGEVPTEFRIFVMGENQTKDGMVFVYNELSAQSVIELWKKNQTRLSIDFEHSSTEAAADGAIAVTGAPAQGWFDLEARPDGLYAINVEWLEPAATYIRDKKYLFYSPVFSHMKDPPYVVVEMVSIGLTNLPRINGLTPLAQCKAGPVTYKAWPVSDETWNAEVQKLRWLQACTATDGKVDWDKYGELFAYVSGSGDKLVDFHLPHHATDGRTLTTSKAGVLEALRALPQTAIPEADRPVVQDHLTKHAAELGLELQARSDNVPMVVLFSTAKYKLSHEQVYDLVNGALRKKFRKKAKEGELYAYIEAVYDELIVFNFDGKTWQIGYVIDGEDVTLTEKPTEVVRTYEEAKRPSEAAMADMSMEEHAKALAKHGEGLAAHAKSMDESTKALCSSTNALCKMMEEDAKAKREEKEEKAKAKEEEMKAKAKAEEEMKAKAKEMEEAKAKALREDPDNLFEDTDEPALRVVKSSCKALIDTAVLGITPALTPGEARDLKAMVKCKQADEAYIKTFITTAAKAKDAIRSGSQPGAAVVTTALEFKFGEKTMARCKAAPAQNTTLRSGGVALDSKAMSEFTVAVCKELQKGGVIQHNGFTIDMAKAYDPEKVQKDWVEAQARDEKYKEGGLTLIIPSTVKYRELSGTGPY